MPKYKLGTDPNTPKREEFSKEFNKNNYNNRKLASAAGERWKLLSDLDKVPYVLKAQELRAKKMMVEDGIEDEFAESDKLMTDKSEFGKSECNKSESNKSKSDKSESDKSVADKSEFSQSDSDKSAADKSEFNKSESDKLKSVKSECEVIDDFEEGSKCKKVSDDDIKMETEEDEDELKTIIRDFARFEEVVTPINPIVLPKATDLPKHLDELEKLISLPLETLLQSSNLIQLQNTLKLVKDLPVIDAKICEWCNTLLEVTTVMSKQRIDIQKVLMETEAKAHAMAQLQREAADIRKTTLEELEHKKECLISIQLVNAKIENLKRQLLEAEAERATLLQLERDLAVGKYQRLKRARIVRNDLAPLIEQNAAINKIILDSKNAIINIDCHLNSLFAQFNVLKNAAK